MTPEAPIADDDKQRSVMERGAAQVHRVVGHVLREGVGPITGAEAYAEDRLRRWSSPTERSSGYAMSRPLLRRPPVLQREWVGSSPFR